MLSAVSTPRSVAVVEDAFNDDLWEDCYSSCDELSCCSSMTWSTSPPPSMASNPTRLMLDIRTTNHVPAAGNNGQQVRSTNHLPTTEGAMSKGSQLHSSGKCTPCKFFRSRRGCMNGQDCELCHFPHQEMTTSAIRKFARQVAVQKAESRASQSDCGSSSYRESNAVSQPNTDFAPPAFLEAPRRGTGSQQAQPARDGTRFSV
mmetsp:Transcript_57598/g.122478  ORF Transcript_57598/g.122478 Transcript_57598/m.122478 type:complete len:203 (-) Transcript_57598:372-980(-)